MHAKDLKNSILQLAVSGKLVPQDASDEPASVLLERILAERESLVKQKKTKNTKVEPIAEEDIPFEVPESWEWVRLEEIGDWKAGATPSKSKPEYYSGGTIPWLLTGDLNDGLIKEIPNKITEKAHNECSVRLNPAGSVLVAMYGATIGKTGILESPATTNQACCACILHDQSIREWLFTWLLYYKPYFNELGMGGAQPNISRGTIVSQLLPLPPLAEQKRIVQKVQELMPLVEEYGKLEEAREKLDAELPSLLKKSVLQQAVQGKLVPQDASDEPASVLLERIREERESLIKQKKIKNPKIEPITEEDIPFEVPESWEWVRLGEIASLVTKGTTPRGGNAVYSEKGIGFLRAENIGEDGNVHLDSLKYISPEIHQSFARSILRENDLLITIAGTLGRSAIVIADQLPLNVNQAVSITRIIDKNVLPFVLLATKAPLLLQNLIEQKKVTAIPNLTLEQISNFLLPLPPLAEQKRIVQKVREVMGVVG